MQNDSLTHFFQHWKQDNGPTRPVKPKPEPASGTHVELSWFCRCTTSAALGCSTCSSCRASWFTTATLEAVAFISWSKLSKRCFMMASSSTSSVTTMVVRNFSCASRGTDSCQISTPPQQKTPQKPVSQSLDLNIQ